MKSLTSQLAFTYSAHRKASRPFSSLLFTSLDKRTLVRLEAIGDAAYKRWIDTEWWSEGYQQLWENGESEAKETSAEQSTVNVQESLGPSTQSTVQRAARESVVYLTADSTEELTALREGETYIIGGICDHNRYKVRL